MPPQTISLQGLVSTNDMGPPTYEAHIMMMVETMFKGATAPLTVASWRWPDAMYRCADGGGHSPASPRTDGDDCTHSTSKGRSRSTRCAP